MDSSDTAEYFSPESQKTNTQVYFQFSRHVSPSENSTNYQKVLNGNLDIHPWASPELLIRLKEIKPRVISIDGAIPGFNPAADDGKSIEGKLDRIKLNAQAHGPWLWYTQPGSPSEYAGIDINKTGEDYILNITADVTHDEKNIFKYLISQKDLQSVISEKFDDPNQGSVDLNNLKFLKDESPDLSRVYINSIVFAGLTSGILLNPLVNKDISRRSFLKGLGATIGGVALGGLINSLSYHPPADVKKTISDLLQDIANSKSVEESLELQKILENSFNRLDPEQNAPDIIRAQGRTALVKMKYDEAIERIHKNGRSWDVLSPGVILFGNAHALETNRIMESPDKTKELASRFGKFILSGITKFNENVSVARNSDVRSLTMSDEQLIQLQTALIDLMALTSVQRVYDPNSISIRDTLKNVGNDIYAPFKLLTQPEDVFVSESVRSALLPSISSSQSSTS